ncbi:6-bladed beta-propeller [Halosquirtibacter xylanolyticus]|uniref:6-bladed beta-propeller n=1 Tax=Halosquirtibacter xylanolyticus TaxID=3374599 RepID=UPI0037495307|nr:6-bladed beta-propeller [Prolixibacteraceae bacterium]
MRTILYILMILCIISCGTKEQHEKEGFNGEILNCVDRLNYDSKNFVDHTELIPLEQTEQSVFSDIRKLIYKNNTYYIGDLLDSKKIFVFNEQGKFIGKVGRLGKGSEEYNRVSDFYVTDDGDVVILTGSSHRLVKYDIQNNFLSEVKLPFMADAVLPLSNDKYIFACSIHQQDERVVVTNLKGEVLNKYLPYDKSDYHVNISTKGNDNLLRETLDGVTFNQPYDSKIYQFKKSGEMVALYDLDFGKNKPAENTLVNADKFSKTYRNKYVEYLKITPLVANRSIYGTMRLGKNLGVYRYDLKKSSMHVKKGDFKSLDLLMPLYLHNDVEIISYVDHNIVRFTDDDSGFTKSQMSFLQNGGVFLVKHVLRER